MVWFYGNFLGFSEYLQVVVFFLLLLFTFFSDLNQKQFDYGAKCSADA